MVPPRVFGWGEHSRMQSEAATLGRPNDAEAGTPERGYSTLEISR